MNHVFEKQSALAQIDNGLFMGLKYRFNDELYLHW